MHPVVLRNRQTCLIQMKYLKLLWGVKERLSSWSINCAKTKKKIRKSKKQKKQKQKTKKHKNPSPRTTTHFVVKHTHGGTYRPQKQSTFRCANIISVLTSSFRMFWTF